MGRSGAAGRTAVLGLGLLAALALQRPDLSAQIEARGALSKLTTVLADLASAVPQDMRSGLQATAPAGAPPAAEWPASVRDAMRARHLRVDTANTVQVYLLVTDLTEAHLGALVSAGANVEITDPAHGRVQARIPASRLQSVAALPFVSSVRLPSYAVRHAGSATSEGDAILHADAVRQQLGLDGTGVKVGVISDGIKGIFATGCLTCAGVANGPIARGDLPDAVGTRNSSGAPTASSGGITGQSFQSNGDLEGLPSGSCGFAGAGAEGTALLEIVHDLAPGAQLSFANGDTSLAFNQAVNTLAASNDVVVDDLGFFDVPFDGSNVVSSNTATALNRVSNRIRAYVTSAGNEADEHYLGAYTDSGVDGTTITGITNAGRLHLFAPAADTVDTLGLGSQPYNLISLPQNGEVVVVLTWDDPAGKSANNYDVYLVRQSTNNAVARSIGAQSGSQDPIEFLDFTNTGATDMFRIVVQNVNNQAKPRQLNVFSFQPECAVDGPRLLAPVSHARVNFNTQTKSVIAQSDAGGAPVSVISVGAVCSGSPAAIARFASSQSPNESCTDTTHATAEFFSSRGPTLDGRMKPDVAAIDGVQVTAAGGFANPFFGTSASAPHVAAEAALLLQGASCLSASSGNTRDPGSSRAALRNLITSGASLAPPLAPDNVLGFGLVNALTSVQKTLPMFGGAAAIVRAGNTPGGARISAANLGFVDPNQCTLTKLQWTGGCGSSPDAALTCAFGASAVEVSASNNGVAFSPASSVSITVTNFAVDASPASASVTAGQSATYQVTVSALGGPFGNSVTLGCPSMPQGANCLFNPPAVTPGSTGASAVMTITTTSRSAAVAVLGRAPDGVWVFVAVLPLMLFLAFLVLRGLRPRVPVAVASAALVLACLATACIKSGISAVVGLSPSSVSFSNQGVGTSSAPKTVTLTNAGGASLSITAIATTGDFSQTNTCAASLAPAASCTLSVTFAPTTLGKRTGALTLTDDAANSPQTVPLTGIGGSVAGPTPAGTFPVTVQGTSGALVQSASVTLVVK